MHVSALSEPCPPTAVQASVDCEQLHSTVSWQQSDLAVGYVAYFENQKGHHISCVAIDANMSCHVSELRCSTVYRVWVKALGQQYNSSASTAFSLTTGKNHHVKKTQTKQLNYVLFMQMCGCLDSLIVDSLKSIATLFPQLHVCLQSYM